MPSLFHRDGSPLMSQTTPRANTSLLQRDIRAVQPPLRGAFVADCAKASWFLPGTTSQVTSAKTLKYNDDNTFEVDYTEYLGSDNCVPGESTPFAKYTQKGTVKFLGANKVITGTTKCSWTMTESTWLFPSDESSRTKALLNLMNTQCPCGGTWTTGVTRTIKAGQCEVKSDAFYLCLLVAGEEGYGSYKWTDDTHTTYVSSPIYFDQNKGWTTKPTSVVRHLLPQGGDTNPEDCDYVRWATYGTDVQDMTRVCRSCTSLECLGCVYRLLPESKDPNAYDEVCPCLWYYGEEYGATFLKIPC
eukprot:m.26507 g.26507  ORF g.26507 m.26507 type:complete len:302 (+) comp13776_c0_seq1:135-1040(+)